MLWLYQWVKPYMLIVLQLQPYTVEKFNYLLNTIKYNFNLNTNLQNVSPVNDVVNLSIRSKGIIYSILNSHSTKRTQSSMSVKRFLCPCQPIHADTHAHTHTHTRLFFLFNGGLKTDAYRVLLLHWVTKPQNLPSSWSSSSNLLYESSVSLHCAFPFELLQRNSPNKVPQETGFLVLWLCDCHCCVHHHTTQNPHETTKGPS